jgi:hypothetical protein
MSYNEIVKFFKTTNLSCLDFDDKVKNKQSSRADLHAFLLLSCIVLNDKDIVD